MLDILLIIIPLVLGYFIGSYLEKKHYVSIRKREEDLIALPAIVLKKPLQENMVKSARLVRGSVVISSEAFKRLLAGLRNIFGGNVKVYESLVDRARREAILRMKESALGADEIINIRIETCSIYKNSKSGNVGSIEVLAYGTALKY